MFDWHLVSSHSIGLGIYVYNTTANFYNLSYIVVYTNHSMGL